MKKIILFTLALSIFPLTRTSATTDLPDLDSVNISQSSSEDLPEYDSNTISDFEVAKVVSSETSIPKSEEVKDIIVAIPAVKVIPIIRIAPQTTASDTNAEIIPPQSSQPAETQAVAKPAVDPEAIKKILRGHTSEFRACYQKVLDSSDTPEKIKGSLNLKFKIAASGKVEHSEITSQVVSSEKVLICIKNTLEAISFPEADKSVRVNQPMNLNAMPLNFKKI